MSLIEQAQASKLQAGILLEDTAGGSTRSDGLMDRQVHNDAACSWRSASVVIVRDGCAQCTIISAPTVGVCLIRSRAALISSDGQSVDHLAWYDRPGSRRNSGREDVPSHP